MKQLTPQEMQKLAVKSQIKKHGGIKGYKKEMKRRSVMGVEAKQKLSTEDTLRKEVAVI